MDYTCYRKDTSKLPYTIDNIICTDYEPKGYEHFEDNLIEVPRFTVGDKCLLDIIKDIKDFEYKYIRLNIKN